MHNISKFATLALAGLAHAITTNLDPTSYSSDDVISRDIVVIGGGSTGTYTALQMLDRNYSVAVVEPKNHLGGNAETYTAPNGWTIDIGVIVFTKTPAVQKYFSRFNVSLVNMTSSRGEPQYIDFSTGEILTNYQPPSQSAVAAGLTNYAEQLSKYPALAHNFSMTYPIASDSDLLLPFGQFAEKYNLTSTLPLLFSVNQGYAPLLDIPTLYMFKYLNEGEVSSFAKGFLTTKNHDVQELYQKAGAYIGTDNVFLNSTVVAMDRSSSPARVQIQTPSGPKLIQAQKVVITAAPLLENLGTFDLSPEETSLFGQFFANGYYTGILTNTSLPGNFSSQAVGPDTSHYNIPQLPGLYSARANPGAPDHIQVYYGSPTILPDERVKSDIVASINRVEAAQGLPQSTPQWAIFSAHTPFNLMVTPPAIQDGFYDRLFALQGRRGTFWNGAAWFAQDSSILWQFTDEYVVPEILASMTTA